MKPPLLMAAIGITVYLLAPGPAQSLLGSWPLTPAGVVALVTAIGSAWLARTVKRDGAQAGWLLFFGALIALRVVLGFVDAPTGWLARYYATADWSGRPEWSSDFRLADATRIDSTLTFGARFPTHYLNGPAFQSGVRREFSEPMSVEWSGTFDVPAATAVTFDGRATGLASVAFDDSAPLVLGSGSGRQQVSAGRHRVTVKYAKPADTDGEFRFSLFGSDGAPITVIPPSAAAGFASTTRYLAAAADATAIAVLIVVFALSLRDAIRSSQRVEAMVGVGLIATLGLQGLITAQPLIGTFKTLTGGDDWLGFESRARDILQNGVLMTLGRPIGEGSAYFYHPFYSYVLAATHAIAGESLFGPIFMHFLVLAVTAYVMWSFARDVFGAIPAALGLAALLVVFEIDFIRYYTVTLLSENIYVLTVTLCLRAFAKWAHAGHTRFLVHAGLWAGLSTATRPAMMMFFVPAVVVAVAIAVRRRTSTSPLASAAIFGTSWFAVVAPFTLRNWIVARKLVLISDGLGPSFITLNLPSNVDPAKYLTAGGGILGGAAGLFRILMDYPLEIASMQVQKIGFTLGMVHWFDGYRPHPELLAITALYFLMLVLSPTMRSATLWPVHAFVLAHVASMGLTSPWNYGYRMILPPFVYTATFSVAAGTAWWRAR